MTPLSSIAMSAYTDLVRLLKDDALSGVTGKPTLKERGDKAYWYAAQRVHSEPAHPARITDAQTIELAELRVETRNLRERLDEMRAERDNWIA